MLEIHRNRQGATVPEPQNKIPPCVHQGGSRLGLPSRRVKWSKSTKTLPADTSSATPSTLASRDYPSMFGTLIDKS